MAKLFACGRRLAGRIDELEDLSVLGDVGYFMPAPGAVEELIAFGQSGNLKAVFARRREKQFAVVALAAEFDIYSVDHGDIFDAVKPRRQAVDSPSYGALHFSPGLTMRD